MLALWVDFPYHFACRRRLRSTVPAFPGLLVPCVRRTSHPIPSENCTAAGSELEHVFARAASAGRPAIAGRFELVTPPLLLPLRLFVPPLQDLLSSTVGGYRGRRCCRGCPVAASRCAEKPVRSASFRFCAQMGIIPCGRTKRGTIHLNSRTRLRALCRFRGVCSLQSVSGKIAFRPLHGKLPWVGFYE